MNIAYFDCFAGASGDMILGALIDAGLDPDELCRSLAGLQLPNWDLQVQRVVKNRLAATQVHVVTQEQVEERRYTELKWQVSASSLEPAIKQKVAAILRRLSEAEARLHGESAEEVHLHELGGLDTLVDIAGAVVGLDTLKIDQVYVSALPMSHGTVETRHGTMPLPSPAVVELTHGVPIRDMDLDAELVTPTGAAILITLANGYTSFPSMTLERSGYGAGQRDLAIPNVLRLLIGHTADQPGTTVQTLVVLETNIDDMNPQLYDYVMARLFEAGALDVWLTPIQMKKNRGGVLLSVLCEYKEATPLTDIVLKETTTLGVREYTVQRHALPREIIEVDTTFGSVHIKVARAGGRVVRAQPEYEDCRRLAAEKHVPLLDVYREAEESAWRRVGKSDA